MVIEGKASCKKALILTPERMKALEKIVCKYCHNIEYKAETVNGSEISFTSLEELLDYDNFGNRRIQAINIRGDGEAVHRLYIIISSDVFCLDWIWCGSTCYMHYEVDTIDIETNLKEDLNVFLQKATSPYWIISKFRLTGLLESLICICFIFLLLSNNGSTDSQMDLFSMRGAIIVACSMIFSWGVIHLCKFIDKYFLARCFPPVVFAWGKGKSQYEKYQRLRGNLLWCVVIALGIGVIASVISNSLS